VKILLVILALTAVPAVGARSQAPDTELELGTVRFYQADGARTLVDAYCRVPFGLLDPLSRGTGGVAIYRLTIAVRDSAGLELVTQTWTQRVPAELIAVPRGSTVEYFTFAAAAGRYTIDVTVVDSATGRRASRATEVRAYDAPPGGSDLLLATGIRLAAGGDTLPGTGEIRKGAVLLQSAGRPVLTPQQSSLGYYLEVYAAAPETATVALRVLRPDGGQVIAVRPQPLPLPAGGGVTRGMVPLAGLPPGEYQLEAAVARVGTDTARRTAWFRMAGFETAAAIAAATAETRRDVFSDMTEAQLDTLYLPLVYVMASNEQGQYPSLTLEGKGRFLRQFWERRDPTPGTARNEAQEDFYARIAEANRRFREGGAAQIPGWRTDRGRIFIKYGEPDAVHREPMAGGTYPFEIWKYTQRRPLKYVFADLTRFGNYALIWTDDIREPSRPNWRELLGPDAVTVVERF
jgi:GWxTD domain-containing protein